MESWTAEEEMIATGQIPAMTPERIAEQERLAREAAQKAAEDAQTASQELRTLAQHDLESQGSVEAPEQGEWTPSADESEQAGPVPSAEVPLVQPAPIADNAAPLDEREIVEPYSPRFDLDDKELRSPHEESADVQVPAEFDPHAKIERTPAPTGDPAHADDADSGAWPDNVDQTWAPSWGEAGAQPEAQPEPEREPAPQPQPETEPEQHASFESDDVAAAAARAKVFEELFPPGSSQAELLEHDRRARESAAESARASIANDAQPLPHANEDDEESERQRGIEEIRRLTEAAISGFERKLPHGGAGGARCAG